MRVRVSPLKNQLQSELDLPGRTGRGRNRSSAAGVDHRIWECEMSRVEEVEELRSEVQRDALVEAKRTSQSHIEIRHPRSEDYVRRRVAEQERTGHGESGWIEPPVGRALAARQVAVAQPVRADGASRVGRIPVDGRANRQPGLQLNNWRDLPIADDL